MKREYKKCQINSCGRNTLRQGYCRKHLQAAFDSGTLDSTPLCTVVDCELVVTAKGLCLFHWQRQYMGTPLDKRKKNANGEGCTDSRTGYRYISLEKGQKKILEHRHVMEQHLNRPLLPNETIHHINGDRSDNRIENLQLRTGNHGPGAIFRCNSCGSHDVTPVPLSSDVV